MNLQTNYMGLTLKNPIIVGASGLTSDLESIKELEVNGAAAIVIKSLFQEEIQLENLKFDEYLNRYNDLHAEMLNHYPNIRHAGAKEHLYWVKQVKQTVDIPVIASINAIDEHTWIDYAKALEETGVDGLELNFYNIPKDAQLTGEDIEEKQVQILKKVKESVKIPVSVKLSPYYTNITDFLKRLDDAKVDGVVLFNRLFQPDIDVENEVEVKSFTLSNESDNRLPLIWTALLSDQLKTDISSSTGIMTSEDVVKMLLTGAASVQIVSTLYKNKIEYLNTIIKGIENWMKSKNYNSIKSFKGKLSKKNMKDPWAFERVQYIKMLYSKEEIFEINR
ncbi:dihydroorotate dehydrogenase-like protein [Serpentinicella alkaliphila]|uniref:Dihydroorotate dehydrogenase (Fumarate) n=1 Tax=Serpentinicella alkaliphila TaxID=1734049 RepID=A0A4R2TLK2_9FIRM|nr:dihydroorotate dehydrogenase-like protein [Serpentinicella alkaliphila]QUH24726.1 dihydroorotate dehydrogenase-like protein [Serpentinicella alkaliphila]TCQ03716.1 dihydroorotate dehydrogenase (fumarate) [Serpentinicella alkaliphila]